MPGAVRNPLSALSDFTFKSNCEEGVPLVIDEESGSREGKRFAQYHTAGE